MQFLQRHDAMDIVQGIILGKVAFTRLISTHFRHGIYRRIARLTDSKALRALRKPEWRKKRVQRR